MFLDICSLPENRITPTELFPSAKIADGNNSVSKFVGITRRKNSIGDAVGIYRRNYSVGIYQRHHRRREIFFENWNGGMTWIFFRRIYRRNTEGFKPGQPNRDVSLTPTESPTEIFRQKIQNILAPPTLSLPLFICFSFFFPFFFPIPPLPCQTAANHPSQLSHLLNTS